MKKLTPKLFLEHANQGLLIDVRSPNEYAQGHIPNACSIPLFSDSERAQVGTIYKQVGKEEALELGLTIVGPKLLDFYKQVKQKSINKKLAIYCWRGGMRSANMAHFFMGLGYEVTVLDQGYKAYRRYVLESVELSQHRLLVLGGFTGSGKTEILLALQQKGQSVIDLEGLAGHKGSAFGNPQDLRQPTQEQFENNLGSAITKLPAENPVWIEDESARIGAIHLPKALYLKIRLAKVLLLQIPKHIRVDRLILEYTNISDEILLQTIHKVSNRLGGLRAKISLTAIQEQDYKTAIEQVLDYYDRSYLYGQKKRDSNLMSTLDFNSFNTTKITDALINSIAP